MLIFQVAPNYPVTPNNVKFEKPDFFTRIKSPWQAKYLLDTFKLMPNEDCVSGRAILLHTAEWVSISQKQTALDTLDTHESEQDDATEIKPTFKLLASQWTGFSAKSKNGKCSLAQSFRTDKNPLFYGYKSVYLIAIDYFATELGNTVDSGQFLMGYKVSTTTSTPQNEQDLGTLVGALVGAAKSVPSGGTKSNTESEYLEPSYYFTLAQLISPTSPLPYTINVTPVLQPVDQKGIATIVQSPPAKSHVQSPAAKPHVQSPPAKPDDTGTSANAKKQNAQNSTTSPVQPIDCTNVSASKPCNFTRNFPVDDKEYWDVSLGLAIPGPKENVFKASTTGGVPTASPTTHTDAYAFADFYLFAKWRNKQSLAPHFNAGIPITSQSLHRPYGGMSLDISGWLQQHGFPLDLCVFGGVVFMKQQIYDSASPTQLRTDWAHKAMYGVEVPISSIASKLGKGSKSSSAKSSGGQ